MADINGAIQAMLDTAKWRKQIISDYDTSANRLLKAYQRVTPRLQKDVTALSTRLTDYVDANDGELPEVKRVKGWAQYQDLIDATEREMQGFSHVAEAEASDLADKAIELGILAASSMVLATAGSRAGVVSQVWQRPNSEAVKAAAGFVNSDAFRQKAAQFGTNAAQSLGDVILASVGQGHGIDVTTRLMTNFLAVPYTWALSTTSTAQMYSWRAANHESYRANPGILDGWMWWADLAGACESCIAMHGTIHSLDETLDDHHHGRCLTPGQMVVTSRGAKPIEVIQIGDYVLTHQGRYRKVTGVFNRDYQGQIVQIDNLKITPEHPVLTQCGWVEASALRASDTLLMLYASDVRATSRKTVHPSAFNVASFFASVGRFWDEWCQLGSYSTASMASGKAKSILNVSTANCGTGYKPLSLSIFNNRNSPLLQKVRQFACRLRARFLTASGFCPASTIRSIKLGSLSIWRRIASLGEIGAISDAFMSFMSERVLMPASFVSSRYVAPSFTYLRCNHVSTDSPNRASNSRTQRAVWSLPISCKLRLGNLRTSRLCKMARRVLLSMRPAISYASNPSLSSSIKSESSSGVHALPVIQPSYWSTGIIIHQQWYSGKVYDLTVEEDHSFFANGIAVHNCTPVPIVTGSTWVNDVVSGADWFAQQPETTQRETLGPGKFDLYQSGKYDWSKASVPYENDVFGTMRRASTLAEMSG